MDKETKDRLVKQVEAYYIKGRRDLERQCARIGVRDPWDKDDVIQDAFCNTLAGLHLFDPAKGNLKKWINSILHNAARDFNQDKRLDGAVSVSLNDVSEDDLLYPIDIEDELIAQQELEMVTDAIAKQPPNKRAVLESFLLMGNSIKEVAALTGLSRTNVTTIVQRFREELGPRVALGS